MTATRLLLVCRPVLGEKYVVVSLPYGYQIFVTRDYCMAIVWLPLGYPRRLTDGCHLEKPYSCQLITMQLSYGCHLVTMWLSFVCHLGNMWSSYGCHLVTMWLSFVCHLGNMWSSYGCLLVPIWLSFGCHFFWVHMFSTWLQGGIHCLPLFVVVVWLTRVCHVTYTV
jgi:hypothetical protein